MLVFIDLDGTLTNTIHPSWRPYRDGQAVIAPDQVPVFPGARDFISYCYQKGIHLVLVSDSHPRYVEPLRQYLGLQGICLADKPNTARLNDYIAISPILQQELRNPDGCFFVGDTKLDIEIGRKYGIRTILLRQYWTKQEDIDVVSGVGDDLGNLKMGATYEAKSFSEVIGILQSPDDYLVALEAQLIGKQSNRAIIFKSTTYSNGDWSGVFCLARQEEGCCDRFARSDCYRMIANPQRTNVFLDLMSGTMSSYIRFYQNAYICQWDYLTYLSDKSTTVPPEKMKQIFDRVESDIPKVKLLKWREMGQGSLRNQIDYSSRQKFLADYLQIDDSINLHGKNVIVFDDQLTTGATAYYVIKSLKQRGAVNVLFIAFFQMILDVSDGMVCPHCGKPMRIKRKKKDGKRFYSCVPPEYGGEGCGNIISID